MQTDDLPAPIEHEIYRGYAAEDMDRVQRFRPSEPPQPEPGFLVDYFGVKTSNSRASWMHGWSNMLITQPPFPHDGFMFEGIEYAAAMIALENAPGPVFTCAEIGAGWGPWTALVATLAARQPKFERVNAFAVEAAPSRFAMLTAHLADNGLLPGPEVSEGQMGKVFAKAVHAAGWWENTTLYFPVSDNAEDAGMAASQSSGEVDYRGARLEHAPIKAVSIPEMFADVDTVDFMHVDIQGGEWELISKAKTFFDEKVRYMLVGTHDRKIEGDLIQLLHGSGWRLFREKPCRFYGMADAPTLTGLTYYDGEQFWANMSLARASASGT